MGCQGCKKKTDGTGCETHKAPQRTLLEETVARVYPSRTWGQPDDEARFGTGIRPSEVRRLSRSLSVACKAPTFVREGGDEDLCAFVYVLCVGRAPSLLDLRDGVFSADGPAGLGDGEERVRERYLRVAFSSIARLATVQEVSIELDRLPSGEVEIRELPRPGVYDPVLLKRMRAVVDLLMASDLTHVDFGLVDRPLPDADASEYESRYAVQPHLVNWLFYAAPPTTTSTTLLPAALPAPAAHAGTAR